MNNDSLTNVEYSGKDNVLIDKKVQYVYISKTRLQHLEYIEKNLSTIIKQAVLKSEAEEAKKK